MTSFYQDLYRYVVKDTIEPNNDRLEALQYLVERMGSVIKYDLEECIANNIQLEKRNKSRSALRRLRYVNNLGSLIMGKEGYLRYCSENVDTEEMSISKLKCEEPIINALFRGGIRTLDFLYTVMRINPQWYESIRNIGKSRVEILYAQLLKQGYISKEEYDKYMMCI